MQELSGGGVWVFAVGTDFRVHTILFPSCWGPVPGSGHSDEISAGWFLSVRVILSAGGFDGPVTLLVAFLWAHVLPLM